MLPRWPEMAMIARRTVMRAGLAIGGGLLLTLHLPGRGRAAQGATAFRAERLCPHRPQRRGDADHGQHRMRPGHLDLQRHAASGRTGGRARPGPARSGAAERGALQQSAARAAGNRRLHLDPRRLVAAAGGRGGCAHHADRGGGGAMGRGCRNVPRGARHGDACTQWAIAGLRRACGRRGTATRTARRGLEGPRALHA